MLIEGILRKSPERPVTILDNAKLIEAAKLLASKTGLLIVCDGKGILQGVVTKTDVVKQISVCQGASCMRSVSTVMIRDVIHCTVSDRLESVSELMKQRQLRNIPVVDADYRPIAVLNAHTILRALLGDAQYEEAKMIEYVKGIGYR